MYQALYRKYRPNDFSSIVGQNHIIEVLKNQIADGKISHAYLFYGVRGTGKTTTAKVFARACSCQNYDKDKGPCNECTSCINNYMDTIEIDAASNNSVDNIRKIIDEVVYMPNFGKYKVYIIDEVHMLSQSAFNALLKTLEEPPSHIIFILCTTEINKVMATIKSRCQKFEFRKISEEDISNRIKYILEKENISYEDEALKLISSKSGGGLRDAISLIDQISAYSDVTLDALSFVLGEAKEEKIVKFLINLAKKDIAASLKIVIDLEDDLVDIRKFPKSIINFSSKIMIDMANGEMEKYYEVKSLYTIDKIADLIILISDIDYKMQNSTNPRVIFETFIVKYVTMMDKVSQSELKVLEDRIVNLEQRIKNLKEIKIVEKEVLQESEISKESFKKEQGAIKKPYEKKNLDVKKIEITDEEKEMIENTEIIKKDCISYLIEKDEKIIAAMLVEGKVARIIEDTVFISYDKKYNFHKNRISQKENLSIVKKAFDKISSKNLDIRIIFDDELLDISTVKKDENLEIKNKLKDIFEISEDKIIIEN